MLLAATYICSGHLYAFGNIYFHFPACYEMMCIEVRVSYSRCSHVHLGYELCNDSGPNCIRCSRIETHPRIDPFCPLCSRLEYRAYRACLFHQLTSSLSTLKLILGLIDSICTGNENAATLRAHDSDTDSSARSTSKSTSASSSTSP
jgi:hypothetical protein